MKEREPKQQNHSGPIPGGAEQVIQRVYRRGTARRLGQVVLWAALAVIGVNGVRAIVLNGSSPAARISAAAVSRQSTEQDSQAVDAFAVRFARVFLSDSSPQTVRPLLVSGATIQPGGEVAPEGAGVTQAEVETTEPIGESRSVVTVACELETGELLHLAIPLVRDESGGVAALGAPAFVSAPGISEAQSERSLTILGADAEDISQLADRFLTAYLSGTSSADLEYLTAPAAEISPLGGLEIVGGVSVRQLGSEQGPTRTVAAAVKVRDLAGAVYPAAYRLRLQKRDRWYVAAIEGAVK